MSEAFYRKYRPQSFSQVIGQKVVTTMLQDALRTGTVAHAFVMVGPRGGGKTTIARILAKAVNCLGLKEGEPDLVCENCVSIQEGRFLDLLEIDAASYTGVDNIREIIDQTRFIPSRGKFKVFIIDEVHMLSKAAFNALLKTLEEPPSHAIFILATTEIVKVPATIISRSQRFDFRKVSVQDILELFEKVVPQTNLKISPEASRLLAVAADGSFRDALSLLDQVQSFGDQEIQLSDVEEILGVVRVEANQKFLDLLLQNEHAKGAQFVKDMVVEGKDLVVFTRSFLDYLRILLYLKMGVKNLDQFAMAPQEEQTLLQQSKLMDGNTLLKIIKLMLEAHRSIKISPVPELPLLTAVWQALPATEVNLTPTPQASDERPAEAENTSPSSVQLGDVVDHWAEVLSKVKEYNHSLLGSLRLGRLLALEGPELHLAFPYSFHKDTVDARKNRIIVEQVLEDVFKKELKIRVFLERDLENNDLLSEAVKVLGK